MRFTRMMILRCMNYHESENNNNNPISVLKKFILGNEIMDSLLCLCMSMIAVIIYCFNSIILSQPLNFMISTLINITVIGNYLFLNQIDNLRDDKLPSKCVSYWHFFKACIKLFAKICMIISYLISLISVLSYSSKRLSLLSEKAYMIIFLDFYHFYQGFRFCFFSVKIFINAFLLPVYISAIFIGYYEDLFNIYFNSVIKTKVYNSRESMCSQNTLSEKNDKFIQTRKSNTNEMCSICLGDFHGGEYVSTLPCWKKHTFHTLCLERWFETKSSCPICRAEFQLKIRDFLSLTRNNINLSNSGNMTELNEILIN